MIIKKSVAKFIPNPYVLALLLSLTHPALATTFTWNGTSSSDFNTATNWTPNGIPGVIDTGIFGVGASSITPTISTTSDTVGTLTINDFAYKLFINGPSGNLSLVGAGFNGTPNTGFSVTNNNILSFTNSATTGGASITNNGTLNLQNASTLSDSDVINSISGVVNFNSTGVDPLAKLNNSGNVNILANTTLGILFGSGNASLAGGTTFTVGNAVTAVISGNITNAGALTKVGTGTLELLGTNSYTGLTTVSAGLLEMASIAGNASVGVSGTLEFVNSATLPSNTVTNAGNITFLNSSSAGTSTVNNNSGGTLSFSNSSSAGTSTITNSNILNFLGTSSGGSAGITNTGTVNVNATSILGSAILTNNSGGTVSLDSTASSAGATIVNNSGGLVSLLANSNIGALSGAGSISLAGNTLTLGNLNQSNTITGTISGAGGVTKIGTNSLLLAGPNNYTGLTTVSAGSLTMESISGNANVGVSGTLNFATPATLGSITIANAGGLIFLNGSSAGTSTITNAGTGILDFANTSSAGTSSVTNNGGQVFFNTTASSAGATVTNNSGLVNLSTNTSIGALSGAGTISLGANTLTVGALNQTSTISGNISGTGGFTKIGTGTQILSGVNNYTGLTTVSAGTLEMASIAGNATIGASGTLDFIGSANISGISIINSGILNFLDNSTDAGATITNNLGSTLTFNSTGNFSNTTIANSGTIDLLVNTNIGSLSGSGNVSIGSSTLTLGNLNLNDTVTGGVTGTTGGITKIGTGNQSLLGTNSYTGLTTVSSGILTMAGTFTGNALVSNGAALALTNYSPVPGSLLSLGLTPTGNGIVDVSGTATLGNATLDIDLAPGVYNSAMTYTLVQGGVVSGTFASDMVIPPLLRAQVTYTPSSVLLNLEPLAINVALTGLNASQESLAENLDLIFLQPVVSPEWLQIEGLLTVSSRAEIIAALDAMSPQRFTAVSTVIDTNMKQITKSLAARGRSFIDHAKGRSVAASTGGFNTMPKFTNSGSAVSALAQRATTGKKEAFIDSILASPEVHFDNMQRLSVADQMHMTENRGSPWVQPFGNVSSLESNSKTSMTGYDVKTGGIMVGFDETINKNFFTGIAGGYSYTDLKFKKQGGDSHIGNAFMSLYATFAGGPWHVDGSISGGLLHFKENRNIIFNIINSTAHNSHNGYVISPHVGVGYEFTVMDAQVEPFINLDYDYNKNKGYTETGANSLNLVMNSRNSSQLLSEFGVLASKTYNECYGTFQPSLSLSFVNVKPTKKDNMLSSFVGEPGNFISVGINKNLNYGSATASATFNYNSGSRLSFAYTANVNNRYNSQQASVVYGIRL